MSHIVTVKKNFKDLNALKKVCDRKSVPCEIATKGNFVKRSLYSGEVQGEAAFQLPDWQYPCVVSGGEVKLDNFGGHWGDQKAFDSLSQEYTREVVTEQLRNEGYRVQYEHLEENGHLHIEMVH